LLQRYAVETGVRSMQNSLLPSKPLSRMTKLYAGDPEFGKTPGGATLTVALDKLAEMRRSGT
jgi:hypothetical protein